MVEEPVLVYETLVGALHEVEAVQGAVTVADEGIMLQGPPVVRLAPEPVGTVVPEVEVVFQKV